MMIAKDKSQKVKQLKYLLLIPILGSMLFYVSCTDNIQEPEDIIKETNINKDIVEESVAFSIIDVSPRFPNCDGDNEDLKDCLNKGIREHVEENFNIKALHHTELSGMQKIYVKFKITKKGIIEITQVKAPNSKLEEEARRVVNSLPKMIPGKHGSRIVNVNYVLPIVFDIQ